MCLTNGRTEWGTPTLPSSSPNVILKENQIRAWSGWRPTLLDLMDHQMKLAPQGLPAWDNGRFLNVWVCNMSEYLGFAYFPGSGIDKGLDGVIIQYTAFGTIKPEGKRLDSRYNLGRTLVHEVGHYLKLPYVFDTDAIAVTDTTNLPGSEANYGKPLFPKISTIADGKSNAEVGGDMFMNYMDYCDDDTTVMFTQSQVARMRTA